MVVSTVTSEQPQAWQNGTNNPALNPQAFAQAAAEVGGTATGMTAVGTYAKAGILLGILLAAAAFGWSRVEIIPYGTRLIAVEPSWTWLAFLLAFISGFAGAFAVRAGAIIAPLFAVSQGTLLGVAARYFDLQFDGIVLQAVVATVCVFAATLLLYSAGIIKVTSRLVLGVMAATGALALLYATAWLLAIFGSGFHFLSAPTPLGIVISLAVVVLGALHLPLDFEFIRRAEASGAPKALEWYGAFGLLLSIIWMYVAILRLLALLRQRRR